MADQTLHLTAPHHHTVTLKHQCDSLTVHIENLPRLEIFRGVYSYDRLPIQFRVLFQNLEEFYQYASKAELRIENKMLIMPVSLLGKTKDFQLPLEEVELTGQMRLRKEIMQLEDKLAQQMQEHALTQASLAEKEETISDLNQQITELTFTVKDRETENMKLLSRIRHLENTIDDLLSDKCKSEINQQESKLTEEYTPAKKIHGGKSKKVKEHDDYGKKLIFKVDERAKHFGKFKVSNNDVEKLHGPTYQLFHNEPLPKEGRYYFDIKIVLIRNNNIVIGLITQKNKEEQFSFKKLNSICYNGYDGSVCEQDRQGYVTIKPKEGQKLRTVVDMTLSQVEWYIMGGEPPRTFIGKATIPASMTKQQLFPYFELYWEGNKVKLNT